LLLRNQLVGSSADGDAPDCFQTLFDQLQARSLQRSAQPTRRQRTSSGGIGMMVAKEKINGLMYLQHQRYQML